MTPEPPHPSEPESAAEALQRLLHSTPGHAITAEDVRGTIRTWNAGAEALFGYGAHEAVGILTAADLVSSSALSAGWLDFAREAALSRGSWEGNVLLRRKGGVEFRADLVVAPHSVGGRHDGFVTVGRAVAPPSTMPVDSPVQFRGFLESAPDAIVIVDQSGHIMLVNGQTERLFGYGRRELLGQPVEILIPARFRERHAEHRKGYSDEPRVRAMGAGLDLHGVRKDGTEFPVEISLSPLTTPTGMVVSSAIRDISDRKRVERALQEKNVELERASLAKDAFLANMSHELRTPLNAIIGFTGTLLMRLPGPLTGEQEKQLATIKTSAKHLLALINDILDVAKIDARRVEVQLEAVDVKEVVEEVAAAMRSLAQQKDLALDVSVPAAPVVLASDRRLLSQILINLAGNAIKFTEQGRVAIAVRDEGRAVVFDVEDSGRGIREEDRARLFEAFSQLDTQSTKPRDGTGLGLHLSQRLAGLLGGAISMESVLDRGSRFTLRLARP